MKIGKLPEPVLIRSVLKQVKHRRRNTYGTFGWR